MLSQTSVRYVKNGAGGSWWRAAKERAEVHLGWSIIPAELLLHPDFDEIETYINEKISDPGAAKRNFSQLKMLLDAPDRHVWITFEDGFMWWCTVQPKAITSPTERSATEGNFCLKCNRPWSNESLGGRLLAIADLPGRVSRTAGFRGTACVPKSEQEILRIIHDEMDPDAITASEARAAYKEAVARMIAKLTPQDFEQLIDLILVRTGWARISTLGKTREGIDVEVENLTADEIAFVQVKSSASQAVLNDYVERFQKRREFYSRMIFAVHTPRSKLTAPADLPVQVWSNEKLADLVVRLGLGEWVENRLA